jgi:hypothetical protein
MNKRKESAVQVATIRQNSFVIVKMKLSEQRK